MGTIASRVGEKGVLREGCIARVFLRVCQKGALLKVY